MLDILRRIVQEVNSAKDLLEALQIIVMRVCDTIETEACGIFIADHKRQQHVLVASKGFSPGVEGVVSLAFNEGLVGLVAERGEPINIEDAKNHRHYRHVPETGEDIYKAFLGVPIVHQGKVAGVLAVLQRKPRRFNAEHEAFLITISAQLAGVVAVAEATGVIAQMTGRGLQVENAVFQGAPGSYGVVIGRAKVAYPPADLDKVPEKHLSHGEIEVEIKRFTQALAKTRQDIETIGKRLRGVVRPEEQALFDAYLRILDDASLGAEVIEEIHQGQWAPRALGNVIKRHVQLYDSMSDEYLRERGADLRDLGQRVLARLQAAANHAIQYKKNTILVGEAVSAAQLAETPRGKIIGIVSIKGSANSHVAILARAMGIPTVMGVAGLPLGKIDGRELVVDGYNGHIHIEPSPALRAEFARLIQEDKELFAGLDELKDLPAETPDGHRVPMHVNAGLAADIPASLKVGAEGVGLYRTEVPFMVCDRFPTEEEQYQLYRHMLESFAPRQVVIRTLDVGGDKALAYLPIDEENPFLGWRGIRVTLDHPEIFLVQVRAMLRASHGLNNLRIMLPMISQLGEIDEAHRLLQQAHEEVLEEGTMVSMPAIGAMVEVPAAVYQAKALANKVDFLSVGSNDLTQYILAVDRNNPRVSSRYDTLHPAVILAMQHVVDSAHQEGKPVSICGEIAGDPAAAILLLAIGFDTFSMNATSLSKIKWVIRSFSMQKARALLEDCLRMHCPRNIRQHLDNALERAGLGGLIRAGK